MSCFLLQFSIRLRVSWQSHLEITPPISRPTSISVRYFIWTRFFCKTNLILAVQLMLGSVSKLRKHIFAYFWPSKYVPSVSTFTNRVDLLKYAFCRTTKYPNAYVIYERPLDLKFRYSEKATKILAHLPLFNNLTVLSNVKKRVVDRPKFCGLLRISDLYLHQ